eukprot:5721106-Heterocapsa_arctica.AAC.1
MSAKAQPRLYSLMDHPTQLETATTLVWESGRQISGAAKHGYTESQNMEINNRVDLAKTFRNTCLGIVSDTSSALWLGKMPSNTTRSKVHLQERKADKLSDLTNGT